MAAAEKDLVSRQPASGDQKPAEPDYSDYNAVKATQYGAIERVRQLLAEGHDVNARDDENVTLLHWAAINNRKKIVLEFLGAGAHINAVGGELMSTPLHWAIRQGHLSMVVTLVQHGASLDILDAEGLAPIHVAAQAGYSSIVAYLVAKGTDANFQDRDGRTPLMWYDNY